MDVEEAGAARPGVAESVAHPGRGCDEGAGPGADELVADRELELALEDVEGVRFVGVDVRLDRAELGIAGELDHLELGTLGLDEKVTVLSWDRLALAGA